MIVMFVLLTSFIYIIRGGNTNQSRRKPGPGTDVVSDFSTLEMTDSLNNRPRRTRSETQEEERRRRRAEAAPSPIYDTLYSA